jgi:hypothetical protein
MLPILHTTVEVLGVTLIAISTLFLVLKQSTKSRYANLGWHKLESVSWND